MEVYTLSGQSAQSAGDRRRLKILSADERAAAATPATTAQCSDAHAQWAKKKLAEIFVSLIIFAGY